MSSASSGGSGSSSGGGGGGDGADTAGPPPEDYEAAWATWASALIWRGASPPPLPWRRTVPPSLPPLPPVAGVVAPDMGAPAPSARVQAAAAAPWLLNAGSAVASFGSGWAAPSADAGGNAVVELGSVPSRSSAAGGGAAAPPDDAGAAAAAAAAGDDPEATQPAGGLPLLPLPPHPATPNHSHGSQAPAPRASPAAAAGGITPAASLHTPAAATTPAGGSMADSLRPSALSLPRATVVTPLRLAAAPPAPGQPSWPPPPGEPYAAVRARVVALLGQGRVAFAS